MWAKLKLNEPQCCEGGEKNLRTPAHSLHRLRSVLGIFEAIRQLSVASIAKIIFVPHCQFVVVPCASEKSPKPLQTGSILFRPCLNKSGSNWEPTCLDAEGRWAIGRWVSWWLMKKRGEMRRKAAGQCVGFSTWLSRVRVGNTLGRTENVSLQSAKKSSNLRCDFVLYTNKKSDQRYQSLDTVWLNEFG